MRIAPSVILLLSVSASPLPAWAHGDEDHHFPSEFLGSLIANGGAETNYLFPDLVPFVEEDQIYLQNWDISGGRIRLETVYANFGDGLFEIRSGDNIGGGQIEIKQRVYINNDFGNEFEDFVIDAAVSNHEGHGHIHFEDFSRFSLHEVTIDDGVLGVGDEVASSLKTSYALSANRGPLYPEYVGYPKYTSSNNGIQQRISVGYGDRYSRGTDGQNFSIAGLPTDQLYWLRQHVDPDNNVMETDETNNTYEILIDLNREGEALLRTDNGEFLQPGDSGSLLPGVPGDFNGDTIVDSADWQLFASNLGSKTTGVFDMNSDGVVGHADFVMFQNAFAAAQASGSLVDQRAAVPEPPSLLLLVAVISLGLLARNMPWHFDRFLRVGN